MLSAPELTAIRATLTASLPGTATVSRATLTSDGMGGQLQAWATLTSTAARVSPNGMGGDTDTLIGGRPVSEVPWMVTLPAGTPVGERDRIAISGMTLEVVSAPSPRSYETCVRVACAEVS